MIFGLTADVSGFFTDGGGCAFLPQIQDYVGYYRAPTGNRIRWGDSRQSGRATHAVAASYLDDLRDDLVAKADLDGALASAQYPDFETAPETRKAIAESFAHATLAECLDALEQAAATGNKPATALPDGIATRSATSVAVTFRQIADGRALDLDDCMRMEYRIASRMLAGHDFYEGVRAVLIDKDGAPVWKPASTDEVKPEMVNAYFANLGERELSF